MSKTSLTTENLETKCPPSREGFQLIDEGVPPANLGGQIEQLLWYMVNTRLSGRCVGFFESDMQLSPEGAFAYNRDLVIISNLSRTEVNL